MTCAPERLLHASLAELSAGSVACRSCFRENLEECGFSTVPAGAAAPGRGGGLDLPERCWNGQSSQSSGERRASVPGWDSAVRVAFLSGRSTRRNLSFHAQEWRHITMTRAEESPQPSKPQNSGEGQTVMVVPWSQLRGAAPQARQEAAFRAPPDLLPPRTRVLSQVSSSRAGPPLGQAYPTTQRFKPNLHGCHYRENEFSFW